MIRRGAWLALAAFSAACAGDDELLGPTIAPCAVSTETVDAYTAGLAELVARRLRLDLLERHEMVSISFALAADGGAADIRVAPGARPAAAKEALRATKEAAPYPRPSFDPKACLVGGRATVWLVGHMRCDENAANAYIDAVSERVRRKVAASGVKAPAREKIALRIAIDRSGSVTAITLLEAASAERGERVAAIARKLSPFDAPDEAIAECVVDQPFVVWVELRGPRASAQ